MSLHGPINVNGQEVGYWSARRIVTGDPNIYECRVDHTPDGFVRHNGQRYPYWSGDRRAVNGSKIIEHSSRHTFTVEHRFEDGVIALAAKVLANAIQNVAHRSEEQSA